MTRDPLDVALSLAREAGWYVFPVNPDPKAGKQPYVRWNDEATTDPEQIATWWSIDFPGAYIGVHTGRSGLVVVDIDEKNGKSGSANLAAAGIAPPDTLTYGTVNGGTHLVYTAPEGVDLTVGANHPVDAVDIRSGNGFAVYYGEALTQAPYCAPAPSWALKLARDAVASRGDSLPVDVWFARLRPGKPDAEVKAARKAVTADGMSHGDMLDAVTRLVQLGAEGRPGVAEALDRARTTYVQDFPEYDRHWDAALEGSVAHYGAPPVTFEITKAERKQLKSRAEGKAPAAKRPAGTRTLEDGPLAVELAGDFDGRWAWTEATGLLRYSAPVWELATMQSLVEAVRTGLDTIEVDEHAAAVAAGDKQGIGKALSLLSRNRARAVADLVLGILMEARLTADDHPDLLNCPNGYVDLRTGELHESDPSLLFTKVTAAEYDPAATSTDWDTALNALPKRSRPYMQVRLGQAMTGHIPEDAVVCFLRGGGDNGKSAILNAIRGAGGDYVATVPDAVINAAQGAHPTELTTLMGTRLAVIEELPDGHVLNTKRLKDIAGTPVMTARRMRQDFVSWKASHSLFVSTNYDAIVSETDHGTWRRLQLVRFPYRFRKPGVPLEGKNDRRGDPSLRDRIGGSADPAVLAWLVQGARIWYARQRMMPEAPERVVRDTNGWRYNADPVMKYVSDALELDEGSAIWVRDLAKDFNAWQEAEGMQQWSARTIASRFAGHEMLPNVVKKAVSFGLTVKPSRPQYSLQAPPPKAEAWLGVRFRTSADTITNPGDALVTDIASRPTTSTRKAKR